MWGGNTDEHKTHPVTKYTQQRGVVVKKMDVPRRCTLLELKELLLSVYFPGGQSTSSGLTLDAIESNVITFSGEPLPPTIKDEPFTVGAYCDSIRFTPVRVYLETVEVIINII